MFFEVQQRAAKSAKWWFTHLSEIDMEPEYQRAGGIWSEADQKFLLDSIINDYDIPKIYVADFTTLKSNLNEDKKRFAVVDGKQRLEALFAFFENDLPLANNFKYVANPKIKIGGFTYKDLLEKHPEIASKVEEYPLPVMHIVTDQLDRINELFVRLNKGAALTGAEKRNAMIGPLPKAIRQLSGHAFFKERVNYQATRGQNLNAAAKLLLFEFSKGIVDTKKIDLDKLVLDKAEIAKTELAAHSAKVIATLKKMVDIFSKKDELLTSQGVVPVYYWLVKKLPKADHPKIRPFLVGFNHSLKENREAPEEKQDAKLSRYSLAARSTNDQGAMSERVEILLELFKTFKKHS
jgi:hypothetical protein